MKFETKIAGIPEIIKFITGTGRACKSKEVTKKDFNSIRERMG